MAQSNLLDFQDPGNMPEELLQVPGFINDLTEYTLRSSYSPNRTLAFLGALSMAAHLTGRSYTDIHGTRTNLYTIALGETGIGKDAPRRTNRKLADAIGITRTLGDAVASGEGLEELIARQPNLLFQPDEVECLMNSLSGPSRLAMGLSDRLRRLYTASNSLYNIRSTAKMPEGAVVPYPHLTLFGTGTPEAFYGTLSAQSIANGLFGRCLVVNALDSYETNLPTDLPLPGRLVDIGRAFWTNEDAIRATDAIDLKTVSETPDVEESLRTEAETFAKMRKSLTDRELFTARALLVRMGEKVAKLALIAALSQNPEHPVITKAAHDWATRFVGHVTQGMLYEAQFHSAEGKFDALMKRFVGLLSKHGGSLDRGTILKNMHIDCATFKRVITTLHLCDAIIEESECGKMTFYTLKSANSADSAAA